MIQTFDIDKGVIVKSSALQHTHIASKSATLALKDCTASVP
jgi:hypothetical protein